MHPRVVAERRAVAQAAMNEAVGVISGRFNVAMPERPAVRLTDAETTALFDLERTAAFLVALVAGTTPLPIQPRETHPAAKRG